MNSASKRIKLFKNQLSAVLTERAKLAAFKIAAKIPRYMWEPTAKALSRILAQTNFRGVKQWQLNYQSVTAEKPSKTQLSQAIFLWLANTIGSLQLGELSQAEINQQVIIDETKLAGLQQLHKSQGLVLALAHSGSWDLAGAFACLNKLPVCSVAENLPAGQFDYFAAIREKLGMKIYAAGQPGIVNSLCAELTSGRVICLLADRDMSRNGIAVSWLTPRGKLKFKIPVGPALIAKRTGAALVPVYSRYDATKMILEVGSPIEHASLEQMSQELIDWLATMITRWPTQWHMMQRIFPEVRA